MMIQMQGIVKAMGEDMICPSTTTLPRKLCIKEKAWEWSQTRPYSYCGADETREFKKGQ